MISEAGKESLESARISFPYQNITLLLGKLPKKTFFLGCFSQMWVGGVADSQTKSKHLKTHPNHKNPGVGKQIWERSPKKSFFVCWVLDAGHGYFYTEYL